MLMRMKRYVKIELMMNVRVHLLIYQMIVFVVVVVVVYHYQAYVIECSYAGEPRKLVLVPFADARDYRVWLAQSKASSGASAR